MKKRTRMETEMELFFCLGFLRSLPYAFVPSIDASPLFFFVLLLPFFLQCGSRLFSRFAPFSSSLSYFFQTSVALLPFTTSSYVVVTRRRRCVAITTRGGSSRAGKPVREREREYRHYRRFSFIGLVGASLALTLSLCHSSFFFLVVSTSFHFPSHASWISFMSFDWYLPSTQVRFSLALSLSLSSTHLFQPHYYYHHERTVLRVFLFLSSHHICLLPRFAF